MLPDCQKETSVSHVFAGDAKLARRDWRANQAPPAHARSAIPSASHIGSKLLEELPHRLGGAVDRAAIADDTLRIEHEAGVGADAVAAHDLAARVEQHLVLDAGLADPLSGALGVASVGDVGEPDAGALEL